MDHSEEITELLVAHGEGDDEAFDRLVPLVYEDLREIAHRQLARHRRGQLDTTSLVHEAYLKLADQTGASWENRRHFFAVAARAMRQIVVDFARRRRAKKRGGDEVIVALSEPVERLGDIDRRLVKVVECRYFAGLSTEEIAESLEVSGRTVRRDWRKAKAWLRLEMQAE